MKWLTSRIRLERLGLRSVSNSELSLKDAFASKLAPTFEMHSFVGASLLAKAI